MMPRTPSRLRRLAPLTAVLLLGTALAACNGQSAPAPAPSDSGSAAADAAPDTLPLATSGQAALAAAPPATDLPAGQPVALRRLANHQQGYGWLDHANYQQEAVQDAPPDYSFDDNGVRPWTWSSGDGSRVISEPVAGGYRTYYYEAGSQQPYLVRDPGYSYAYENGALVAVFTLAGALLDPVDGSQQAIYASRYYDRGTTLWQGASSAPRVPVNAYAWSDRRADLSAQRVAWQRHVADNPDWAAWNNAHAAAERSQWNDVRAQHQAAAQQFSTWQQQRFQGSPPQLYAQPDRPQPERPDHTGAIVGGVVAGAAIGAAAHAAMNHRAAPEQPGAAPARERAPAYAPRERAPAYAPGERHEPMPANHAAPREPVARAPVPMRAEPAEHHAPPHAINHQPERPGEAPHRQAEAPRQAEPPHQAELPRQQDHARPPERPGEAPHREPGDPHHQR